VRSKLELEVLLVVIEEERLHNFVIPQLEEGFSGFSILGWWVVKVGGFYLDDKVLAVSFKSQFHGVVVDRLPVPGPGDCKFLPTFFISFGSLLLQKSHLPNRGKLCSHVPSKQGSCLKGAEFFQPVEVGLWPRGLKQGLVRPRVACPVYGICVPLVHVGREVSSGNPSSPSPHFPFHVDRSTVVHGKTVLDSIPVAIEDEHEVLAVRSKLELEVLLVVIEEERLHNFVIPQLEEGFSGFSILGWWVVKVGGFYLDDKVLAVSFKVDHDRFVVNRLPVPRSCDLKLLTPFLWHPLANL